MEKEAARAAALRPRPLAADPRHRRLQAASTTPTATSQGDEVLSTIGPDPRRGVARDRLAGPLRRRGVRGRAAGDRYRRRGRARRADPRADRGARRSSGSTATGEIRVTASIGLATMPGSAADAQELIATADAALYEAKRSGKNRVVVAPSRRCAPRPGAGPWEAQVTRPHGESRLRSRLRTCVARCSSVPAPWQPSSLRSSHSHGNSRRRDPGAPRSEAPPRRRGRRACSASRTRRSARRAARATPTSPSEAGAGGRAAGGRHRGRRAADLGGAGTGEAPTTVAPQAPPAEPARPRRRRGRAAAGEPAATRAGGPSTATAEHEAAPPTGEPPPAEPVPAEPRRRRRSARGDPGGARARRGRGAPEPSPRTPTRGRRPAPERGGRARPGPRADRSPSRPPSRGGRARDRPDPVPE